MSTDVRFSITVDNTQADAANARTRKEVMTLAGEETRLAASVNTAERAMTSQAAASNKNATALAGLQASAKNLQKALGPTAAAISFVSSSMGGMNGEMGKAVAGAGQVVAAFGAGGPLAAAFVAGMFAVNKFGEHLEEVNRIQDAAIEKAFAHAKVITDRTRALREENALLKDSLLTEQQRVNNRQIELIAQERALRIQIESNRRRAEGTAISKETASNLRTEASLLEGQAKALDQQITLLGRSRLASLEQAEAEKAKAAAIASATAAQERQLQREFLALTSRQDIENELDRPGDESAYAVSRAIESMQRAYKDLTDAEKVAVGNHSDEVGAFRVFKEQQIQDMLANVKRMADVEDFAAREENAKKTADLTEQYAGRLANIGQNLVADLIMQREHAFERAALTIAAEAGQVLIGEGTKLAGVAVVSALTGNLPAAAAQGAGSAGLIAAGVGLGGAAMGIGGLLGGGSGGSALAFTQGPQAPRQGVGSGGQQGGGNVTIIYGGASGPSADMGAQNVTTARGLAADRRFDEVVRR